MCLYDKGCIIYSNFSGVIIMMIIIYNDDINNNAVRYLKCLLQSPKALK